MAISILKQELSFIVSSLLLKHVIPFTVLERYKPKGLNEEFEKGSVKHLSEVAPLKWLA